jgi:DNA-binding response OmpR family regulator
MTDDAPVGGALEQPALMLAVVDDLMVRSRIDAAAQATGVEVSYVTTADEARRLLDGRQARALLVGMAATRRPWADLVRALKDDPATHSIYVLAFGPHKNLELRARALEAGADRVLANSAFVRALPALLAAPTAPAPEEDE